MEYRCTYSVYLRTQSEEPSKPFHYYGLDDVIGDHHGLSGQPVPFEAQATTGGILYENIFL
jgi:hypothetical protein